LRSDNKRLLRKIPAKKRNHDEHMEEKTLVNRVAASGLVTIRLEDYFPKVEIEELDLKDYLFQGLILREKDFRAAMQAHDWSQYQGKELLVYCSNDAIIPMWAYMLVAAYAAPIAAEVYHGDREAYYRRAFQRAIDAIDPAPYEGERVVIKGCGERPVPPSAYVALTAKLRPHAKSIMYGEPCSTVPIYKRPRE
jgi:hypothetical protein